MSQFYDSLYISLFSTLEKEPLKGFIQDLCTYVCMYYFIHRITYYHYLQYMHVTVMYTKYMKLANQGRFFAWSKKDWPKPDIRFYPFFAFGSVH